MGRKKNCTATSRTTQAAQEHVNKTHQEIDLEIDGLIESEFGRIFGDDVTLDATIQEKTNNVRKHTSAIRVLKRDKPPGWITKVKETKEKLNRARIDLSKAKKDKRLLTKKKRISNKLVELLKDKMHQAAVNSNYTYNPSAVIGALKVYLMERTGVPFRSVNDLDYSTLNLKYQQLKKWFDNQDKGRVPKGFYGNFPGDIRGAYDYTLKNPADVVLANDKSLMGIALHRKILDTLPKKSAKKVQYKNIHKEYSRAFKYFLYENNITYFSDPNNQPENPDKLTPSEQNLSNKNILELHFDLMDGRTKYIVPQPSSEIIIKKQIMDKYNKIITYANNSGFNVSRDIHEVEVGEDVYYYVTMKETQDDGTEIYKAYLAPHFIDDNGRTRFHYPLTKGGKRNGAWVAAINAAQKANKDIINVMTPGFRQAQVEKIFNGFNIKNEEINVKGYAQYIPLDLDINHPMFKTKMIKRGTKGSKPVSVWTNIQDERQMLAEIFDDWQTINKNTLKKLEDTFNRFPELKQIIDKQTKDEEVTETYIGALANVIEFGKMIYLDENGNVQSPNTTVGIRENYHPNMYEMHDRIADIQKAITGIENELGLIDDRISQLQYKKSEESDPETISDLNAAIIRAKAKKLEYLGDPTNPKDRGVLEILREELEQVTDIKAPEEMPTISAQSMVAYGKHRKLYTNALKDPSPDVLYGGRRKDPNVISEYIDNIFDTTFDNELKQSTIDAAFIVDKQMMDYLIEEVKATLGRTDVKAGLPFLEYSNERLLKGLNKIMPGLTGPRLQQIASNFMTMTSGALLGISTGIGNRLQSIMGTIIEVGSEAEARVADIWENDQELVDEIVSATGAIDTVQTVADMFVGALSSQADLADGFNSKKDLLLLSGQNRLAFIKNATGIRRWLLSKVKQREGDVLVNVEQMDLLMDGMWEFTHGIIEGTMSDAMLESIYTKLKRVASRQQLKIYASWGMHMFGIGSSITELKGLEEYASMIPGEKQMRSIMALRAVIHYSDVVVGGEMTGNYLHPEAIAHARAVINNTMFQFSLQNFGKAYRGAAGATTMKFKNYWNMQSRRELQIIMNWLRSMKGKSFSEKVQEATKVMTPTKNMPIPYINRLFGYDPDDVGSFNIDETGPFPYMEAPSGRGTDKPTEMTRQYVWSRVLTSFFTTVLFSNFRIYRNVARYMSGKGMPSIQTLGRGGESTLASLGFRLIQLGLGITALLDDDEEEFDENKKQLYRLFFPIYMNVMYDTIKSKDPLAIFRIHGQWSYDATRYVGEKVGFLEED
jgi:hypothetical protein